MKRLMPFVGLSLFAFVFFAVTANEPALPPAPVPVDTPVTPVAAPVAQDEPKVAPNGVPEPAPPLVTPPESKSKPRKHSYFSRAYVRGEERDFDGRPGEDR